jgi:hypothetical protein
VGCVWTARFGDGKQHREEDEVRQPFHSSHTARFQRGRRVIESAIGRWSERWAVRRERLTATALTASRSAARVASHGTAIVGRLADSVPRGSDLEKATLDDKAPRRHRSCFHGGLVEPRPCPT